MIGNHQHIILKAILERENFNKHFNTIQKITSFKEVKEIKIILSIIKKLFEQCENNILSVDELIVSLECFYPTLETKTKENINTILNIVRDTLTPNPTILSVALNKLKEKQTLITLNELIVKGITADTPNILPALKQAMIDAEESAAKPDTEDVSQPDLPAIIKRMEQSVGLRWPLNCLNDSIGPLTGGTLGHIFARTETGKSAFGIQSAVCWAEQIRNIPDTCILYLGNEEPMYRLQQRMIMLACGKPYHIIKENPEYFQELYEELTGNRIFCQGDIRHVSTVEYYIHKYKPIAVIIDQGPKVEISVDANEVGKLRALYMEYRRMAVVYDTIIMTIGQADDGSENKLWLQLSSIDSSKVGIPGELDFAIGIGAVVENESAKYQRFLSVCKSKLTGILTRKQVRIIPEQSRYVED